MARSDYAHWNEDQDYMWWNEEGKHTEEEPYDPDEEEYGYDWCTRCQMFDCDEHADLDSEDDEPQAFPEIAEDAHLESSYEDRFGFDEC